jgi:hypothetical protein
MTDVHNLVLRHVLGRLCEIEQNVLLLTWDDVKAWPDGLLDGLIDAVLLRKTSPATSLVCRGCDHACPMEVMRDTDVNTGNSRSFIVCDRRDDVGYVSLGEQDLLRWQMTGKQLACFLARELNLAQQLAPTKGRTIALGSMNGKRGSRPIFLNLDGKPRITIGGHPILLDDVLEWRAGRLGIAAEDIQLVADQADEAGRYVTSTARREARKLDTRDRHLGWQKAYRRLKGENPSWSDEAVAATIADADAGPKKPKAATVRRYMKP